MRIGTAVTEPGTAPARRLFFALWPDAHIRAAMARATRTAVRRSGGRPVPPANFHLTLAFLGHQPAALFDDIVHAGARVTAAPVAVTLDRFGYWPKPRVFWFGPAACPPALGSLAGALWDAMEKLGLRREARAFRPHVTLARKVPALPEVPARSSLKWIASGFALIESVTDQRGALYTVVHEFPLRGPD